MKIETVNVIEGLDGWAQRVVSFSGENAEEEANQQLRERILKRHDPENNPPTNVMGFDEESFKIFEERGWYDDDNGYLIQIIHSS